MVESGQDSGRLVNLVEVERRFRRSVNLDRDAGSSDALDGYIVTPAVRRALAQIADGLDDGAGDRTWSLVGPYGSGKSAFAVALADLLSPDGSPGSAAAKRLLTSSAEIAVPRQRLHPVLATAERAPLDMLLLKALRSTVEIIWAKRKGRKPGVLAEIDRLVAGSPAAQSRCAASDVVGCFEEAVQVVGQKTGCGLLLIVDEAGKALEYAARQPTRSDVYLLQALAEAAARSKVVPFLILTVLHQSFDQYALRLDASDRNEWAKVQGRFGELVLREGGDQIIRLTAAAIRRTGEPPAVEEWTRIVSATAAWICAGTGWNESQLVGYLEACWPLHPVATALLGPLFRGGLAQNERSLFAFLSAGEPLGFRDFLRSNGPERLYTVDRLYDYVAGMLGHRVLGRDGRRWAEIDTALRRLPPESDAVDEQVLKTVGLLGMLGDHVGLRASAEIVAASVDDDRAAVEGSLERLARRSALVFRKFRDAFQIWEGSDLDLDELVLRADRQLGSDFSVTPVLQRQAPQTPLVARRHLFETGTLRFFEVHFVEASRLISGEQAKVNGEGDGIVILALPRTEQEADDLKDRGGSPEQAVERLGAAKPVVVVVPESAVRLWQLARELAAAQIVRTSTPDLQADPAATTELRSRIEELERQLVNEVGRAFDPRRSDWFSTAGRLNGTSWRDASSALSELCDNHYAGAPRIRNELLNRRTLSTSAARARRNLVEAMILRRDVARLGFEGNPPEVSMYRSLLEAHGFHRRRKKVWGFGAPKKALRPLWNEIEGFLADTEAARRPLIELYDRLRRPPFGIKDGPLPVIVVAALLARDDDVAVYERGSFMPGWTPSHAERLLRSPDGFEVRQCRTDGLRRAVLMRLAKTRPLSTGRKPALLDVVRALVRFVAGLPPYARRTLRVSQRARDIRDALVRAREPGQLVFEDLPAASGCPPFRSSQPADPGRVEVFAGALEAGLRELRNALPALCDRARATLARHLNLPAAPAKLAEELQSRAARLAEVAVDPMLRAFVLRASDDALAPDDQLTSLLTQLANKPPPEWADADEDQLQVRVALVGRAFHSAESLLVGAEDTGDGPGLLRLAVARRGRPERDRVLPVRPVDEARIAALRDRILDAVNRGPSETTSFDRDRALAALALAAESLFDDSDPSRKEMHDR